MHARAECPICRAPLRAEDLFDAATEEEVEAQRLQSEHTGNYGAKVRPRTLDSSQPQMQCYVRTLQPGVPCW